MCDIIYQCYVTCLSGSRKRRREGKDAGSHVKDGWKRPLLLLSINILKTAAGLFETVGSAVLDSVMFAIVLIS